MSLTNDILRATSKASSTDVQHVTLFSFLVLYTDHGRGVKVMAFGI